MRERVRERQTEMGERDRQDTMDNKHQQNKRVRAAALAGTNTGRGLFPLARLFEFGRYISFTFATHNNTAVGRRQHHSMLLAFGEGTPARA